MVVLLGTLGLLDPATALAGPARAAATTWHEVSLPFLWPQNEIYDMAAAAPGNVWISGVQGRIPKPWYDPTGAWISRGNPVVRKWAGSAWQEFPLRGWTTDGELTRVGAAPGEVWVAKTGYYGSSGYLGRFDGTAFQPVAPPGGTTGTTMLGDLQVDPSGVWLWSRDGGTGGLYRWNGSGWDPAQPAGYGISRIVARNAGDAWAVGYHGGSRTFHLMHWNGAGWQVEAPFPASPSTDGDLSMAGPRDLWAVTDEDGSLSGPGKVWHWADGTWTEVPVPAGYSPGQLAVDGSGRPWVSKSPVQGTLEQPSPVLYHDGTGWQQTSVRWRPSELTAVPGSDDLWALAWNGLGPVLYTNS